MTSDEKLAQQWAEAGFFDYRTSVMLIDPGMGPERRMKDIPRGTAAIYSAIPDHAEELLIVKTGTWPARCRYTSSTSPSRLPHGRTTSTTRPSGTPVTVKTKLIARMALDAEE